MNKTALLGVLAALLPAIAAAERDAEPDRRRDVAAERSRPVSSPRYESVFEHYRRWRDEPMESWREVNDRVGRIGGHAGVLKADAEESSTTGAPADQGPHGPAGAPGGHRHGH